MDQKESGTTAKGRTANVPLVQALFAEAALAHRTGQFDRAEQTYHRVLSLEPDHADSLHRLGLIAYQRGDHALAEKMMRRAIAHNPGSAPYHGHLAMALAAAGKTQEAVRCCHIAMSLDPASPDVPNNLGLLLLEQGGHEAAASAFRRSIALEPGWPEAHGNLGDTLLALGQLREAEAAYRQALSLAPDFAGAHVGLARLSHLAGRQADAICFYRQALGIAPENSGILGELALAFHASGDRAAALRTVLEALGDSDSAENRKLFILCVKDLRLADDGRVLRPLLLRALEENWCRPDDLALPVADLVKMNLEAAEEARLLCLAGDLLLCALLRLAPNQDLELEQILTRARQALLQRAVAGHAMPDALAAFGAVLAQQCFLNEYVFACEEEEHLQAVALRDRLEDAMTAGDTAGLPLLLTVACYFPLHTLAGAGALPDMAWSAAATTVLTQQVIEPLQEQRLRREIPVLTEIRDSVSKSVEAQYSQNPYPRWVRCDAAVGPLTLPDYVRQQFPLARIEAVADSEPVEILVAGCGTGRNAIETAQRFKQARTLAVDLSLASLAHAMRKSAEQGVAIDYAQADLLELALPGRRFDLIEAVGVLHHLADPFAGWRRLVALLKPGGFMNLGLYSRAAREDVRDARAYLSGETGMRADDIRKARRRLIEAGKFAELTGRPDFFTISSCRDLLFHVQEHQLDLREIAEFMRGNSLNFLGFWTDAGTLSAYQQRFADDPAATDLAHWRDLEMENPRLFAGMYQFWVQKAAIPAGTSA
jgi:Tfp pilus assembly protein PilF/2-polyprenyl-3-methyl-5-hydroxy-6-metoxy-1,4-benzoquinol methylase